jgi:hypothetical protein
MLTMKTATKKQSVLRFPRRPVTVTTVMGDALAWYSRYGRYRVIRFPEYEHGVLRFRSSFRAGDGWSRLGFREKVHRKLRSAIFACQIHHKESRDG